MSIAIISLKYLEPDYQQTLDCIQATGLPCFFADRDGVGNMSRAFNDAFIKHVKGKYDYVWFITNITFDKDVPFKLADCCLQYGFSGVHPVMRNSDHAHQHPQSDNVARKVPFIEFTAPMFKTDVFEMFMLDENLWYYYMDIELCYRLHQAVRTVGVDYTTEINHTYLRNSKPYPITVLRKQLRELISKDNRVYLELKYGKNWQSLFNWKQ